MDAQRLLGHTALYTVSDNAIDDAKKMLNGVSTRHLLDRKNSLILVKRKLPDDSPDGSH